jgi:beta-galactosidase
MKSLDLLVELKARGISAGVYTQTTDVEGEINGLVTYDRAVIKTSAAKLAELHRRLGVEITR